MAEGTLASGRQGTTDVCVADGCYTVTTDGGSWKSEVSWDFSNVRNVKCPSTTVVNVAGGSATKSTSCATMAAALSEKLMAESSSSGTAGILHLGMLASGASLIALVVVSAVMRHRRRSSFVPVTLHA